MRTVPTLSGRPRARARRIGPVWVRARVQAGSRILSMICRAAAQCSAGMAFVAQGSHGMADLPEPEAEVSPRATPESGPELPALSINLTIRDSARGTGAPPAASSSERRPGPQPAASEARGPSPEPVSAWPRGSSPPKRFYAVVRSGTDNTDVVGVYHCTWKALCARLPARRLQIGKTSLRGFDTQREAEEWFLREWPEQR